MKAATFLSSSGSAPAIACQPMLNVRRRAARLTVATAKIRAFDAASGTTVSCESGKVWLTLTGHSADVVLRRGEQFICPHTGRVVIEGLSDAVVGVEGMTGD